MSQYHSIDVGETERFFTVVARASGAPIVAGTVNYYLKAKSGADAGKWWKNSDQTWAVAETANAMTHDADGHWEIDLASTPFAAGVRYLEYTKESGDLHVPQARHLVGASVLAVNASGEVTPTAASKTGYALASAYDAAKSAASQTSVDDLPTNAEFALRTLAAADYATAANLVIIAGYIDTEIQTILGYVDCLPATWVVPGTLTAGQVRTELATELGRIDAAITSRHAAGAAVAKSPASLDWEGDVTNKPPIGTSTFDPTVDLVLLNEGYMTYLARLDVAVSTRQATVANLANTVTMAAAFAAMIEEVP